MGKVLEALVRKAFNECEYVGDIRGRDLFWGIEFVRDNGSKRSFDPSIRFGLRVQQAAFELGVAAYPGSERWMG